MSSIAFRDRSEAGRRLGGHVAGLGLESPVVVLVDDGIATGVTALAALRALRLREPKRLVLGVPICAGETAEPLRAVADEVVCAEVPERFGSVGHWHEDLSPTSDDEVLDLLARPADARRAAR